MARPTLAQLDLDALVHNVGVVQRLAPGRKIMAVIKANAYGHGAITVARALHNRVDALAVASIEEALELRRAGVEAPILLLEGVFAAIELLAAAEQDLWLTVENEMHVAWLEQARLPKPVGCWLKVNTGMNRLGVTPDQAPAFFARLQACDNVADGTVLSTHFACADDLDSPMTRNQLDALGALDIDAPRSAANSAGILAWPDSHLDWVRPGYMLYGNSPMLLPHANADALKPVMSLKASIISLREVAAGETVGYGATWTASRDSRIATLCIGYGDGYPRQMPAGAPVLIRGQRAPLAGRVSMDMVTVDVTDVADAQIGDEVILWGDDLPLSEVAAAADSNGYELLTRMPSRTPRVHG